MKSIIQRAEKQTVKQADDCVVGERLYPAIGLAFGFGSLVGSLVRRK